MTGAGFARASLGIAAMAATLESGAAAMAQAPTGTLVVTPPAGTVVQRGQAIAFQLTVTGLPPGRDYDFTLARVPGVEIGQARGRDRASITFTVPADAAVGRIDLRATATPRLNAAAPGGYTSGSSSRRPPPTPRPSRREIVAETYVVVAGPGAQAPPSPSPSASAAAGTASRWKGTNEGVVKQTYCDDMPQRGDVDLQVTAEGTVTGTLTSEAPGRTCRPPGQVPYTVPRATSTVRITGRRTATGFELSFQDGETITIRVNGREARGVYARDFGGGASARTTMVLRCVEGCP